MSLTYRLPITKTVRQIISVNNRLSALKSHCAPRQFSNMAPIPKSMKAVEIDKTGGVEVLQYKEVPVPTPEENEVLIKNEFIGVNYIDTYFRTGLYPNSKPMILGREGSGSVASLGSDVPGSLGFSIGDKVVYMGTSAYADFTACPADKVLKIPTEISTENACASILQGLTALTLVEEAYQVQFGDWVLVLAVTGGVGGWLCQILRAKGAKTIGTVGSEEKVQTAKDQGADVVVIDRSGQGDVLKTVRERTNDLGVAAVFDGVGKETFERSLECVARKGTYVFSNLPISRASCSAFQDPAKIPILLDLNRYPCLPCLVRLILFRSQCSKLRKCKWCRTTLSDIVSISQCSSL